MQCSNCSNQITQNKTGRRREHCSDACRSAAYRKRHGHIRKTLTPGQVDELRRLRAAGASYKSLAETFSLSVSHTKAICYGKYWTKQTNALSAQGKKMKWQCS